MEEAAICLPSRAYSSFAGWVRRRWKYRDVRGDREVLWLQASARDRRAYRHDLQEALLQTRCRSSHTLNKDVMVLGGQISTSPMASLLLLGLKLL